jgi:flavin reductase (DIM6/NTAB) family NADH-FMN oxidoreductase RutF
VSFAVSRTASIWTAMSRAETIAVHVLSRTQEDAARTFATSGIDRFAEYRAWRMADDGTPGLTGVLARMVCRVVRRITAGDHTIVLAAPTTCELSPDGAAAPLVYHAGRYTTVERPP